ncbi:MAG: cupin domain-containing protein [Pseudomonadota bacterium]
MAAPAFADDADSPHHDFFFDTMQDALGREIVYPEGPARVMAAYGHLAPGESTEWHVHEFPIYIQILEGELTVDYGDGLVTTFGPGDSLVEVVDFVHKGSNLGDVPVKTIAVYIGAEGLEASVDVD